jgi:hypothetical protein
MNQRIAFAHPRMQHFADENIVVAGCDALVNGAFHLRQNAREQRDAGLAGKPFQTLETVLSRT